MTGCLRPLRGVVGEAMLVGPLGTPDDSCGGSRRIEPCMRSVSLVGTTELTMDGRVQFAIEFDQDHGSVTINRLMAKG